jgi:hypothetical protein
MPEPMTAAQAEEKLRVGFNIVFREQPLSRSGLDVRMRIHNEIAYSAAEAILLQGASAQRVSPRYDFQEINKDMPLERTIVKAASTWNR